MIATTENKTESGSQYSSQCFIANREKERERGERFLCQSIPRIGKPREQVQTRIIIESLNCGRARRQAALFRGHFKNSNGFGFALGFAVRCEPTVNRRSQTLYIEVLGHYANSVCQASAKVVRLLRIDVCVNGYDARICQDLPGYAQVYSALFVDCLSPTRVLFFRLESIRIDGSISVSGFHFSVLCSVFRSPVVGSWLLVLFPYRGQCWPASAGQRCHILSNSSNYDLVSSV